MYIVCLVYLVAALQIWLLTHWPPEDMGVILKHTFYWLMYHNNVASQGEYYSWWFINICAGNGLVPDGTKPLPAPMLTQVPWHHVALMEHKYLQWVDSLASGKCDSDFIITVSIYHKFDFYYQEFFDRKCIAIYVVRQKAIIWTSVNQILYVIPSSRLMNKMVDILQTTFSVSLIVRKVLILIQICSWGSQLTISEHWFMLWLGVIRQKAIIWTYFDQDIWCIWGQMSYITSLGPHESPRDSYVCADVVCFLVASSDLFLELKKKNAPCSNPLTPLVSCGRPLVIDLTTIIHLPVLYNATGLNLKKRIWVV